MGPRRKDRISPSQTRISVQDVPDYSTPEGAAMANEEMRRLQMQVQEISSRQSSAPGSQDGGGGSGGRTPPGGGPGRPGGSSTEYTWTAAADSGPSDVVDSGQTVEFRGVNGIRTVMSGNVVLIYGKDEIFWDAKDQSGAGFRVYDEQLARFAGVNGVTTRSLASDYTIEIDRPLELRRRGVAVGDQAVTIVDFWNATPVRPGTHTGRVWFDVRDYGSGERRIEAYYAPGDIGSYDWSFVTGITGVPELVSSGETVTFQGLGSTQVYNTGNTIYVSSPAQAPWFLQAVGTLGTENVNGSDTVTFDAGGDLSVVRTTRTITYSYTNPNPTPYSWNLQANAGPTETIGHNETVTFQQGGDIGISRIGNTITVSYTNPNPTPYALKVQDDGVDVGAANVDLLNFDSNGGTGTSYIEWEVTDLGAGDRRIRGKYTPGSGGSYNWNLQANSDPSTQIDTTETVTFQQGGDIGISRVGNTITVSYTNPNPTPYALKVQDDGVDVGAANVDLLNFDSNGGTGTNYIEWEVTDLGSGDRRIRGRYTPGGAGSYNWIASDGPANLTVASGDEVTWTGQNGATVTLDNLTKIFTINRPLQLQQDGTPVGAANTTTVNFDNDTGLKPAGYTARVWTEVLDDGSGVRRILAYYDPAGASYAWNLQVNGGASTQIDNAETVNFVGRGGIVTTRVSNTVYIEPDPLDPPMGGGSTKRVKTGELVFSETAPDYLGSPPAYLYGTRLYVDIVHNWNLSNMNNYHLELVDRSLDDSGVNLEYYRGGTGSMAGQDLGVQPFRGFPHWKAIDRNTIRVYGTMSRLKPTQMRFRYTLVEL